MDINKERENLIEKPIPGLVMGMAVPSVIMQIITLIYNTVDTYFISQIDKSAAAAVGTVFAIQAIIQAVGFGFGMGVSSLCSRKLGEGRDDEANMYASSGIFGAFLVALLITFLGFLFMNPILRLIGCTDTMLEYGRGYAMVILAFAPIVCASHSVFNLIKAEGHIRYSMYGNIIGAVVNVILDPVFIFTLGMGTAGAALATTISQLISLGTLVIIMLKGKTIIKPAIRHISRDISVYIQVITTGLPTVFRQGLGSIATAALCKQGSHYGDAAVAAVTIANKCYMLVRNIVLGMGQGAQPVAGYNYGAGEFRRARRTYDFAMLVGTGICVSASIILYFFAPDVMWWFCKDEEVFKIGVPALRFACFVMPAMSFSTLTNQEYQSYGLKKQATFLASCRQGICFLPVIFILPHFIGVTGVEMAQPLADLFTFIISIPFYFVLINTLEKKEKAKTGM